LVTSGVASVGRVSVGKGPVEDNTSIEVFEDEGGPPAHDNGDGTASESTLTPTDVEFIRELVQLFVDSKLEQGLEERIRDLELIVGSSHKSDLPEIFGGPVQVGEVPWFDGGV
jgi:hypothetical protein